MSDKNQPTRKDTRRMQITSQFFHIFMDVAELYPKYSLCQHLAGFLRRKDPNNQEFYFWSNEELLKKIEQYKDELEGEDLLNIEEED